MENEIKILFVSSGNSLNNNIAPFIYAQGESLKKRPLINLDYFKVIGKGISGYLENIKSLRKLLKEKKYNLIHAHYSLTCWVVLLAHPKIPVIVSLMGDDAYGTYNSDGKLLYSSIYLILLSKLLQPFVNYIIVKSKNIEDKIFLKNKCSTIPNGVIIDNFPVMGKSVSREKLNLPAKKKIILFLCDPSDSRKNYKLAVESVKLLEDSALLLCPYPISHKDIPYYLAAADVMIFTSTAEGSPNLIKEAMTCNCPIVSTEVGDVRWVMGNTKGCYLTTFDPKDVAEKLKLALCFSEITDRTRGREKIMELNLDSDSIADRLIEVYNKILKN